MPIDRNHPVYRIGVAARLVDCHPQTLRLYERIGLVVPQRTDSNQRAYSENDIERLRQVQRLTQELGINLAGVEVVLDLLDKIGQLRDEMQRRVQEIEREYEEELERLRRRLEGSV